MGNNKAAMKNTYKDTSQIVPIKSDNDPDISHCSNMNNV